MAEERARQEVSYMERSLGFADDSVMLMDISSEVFELSNEAISSTERLDFTASVSDDANFALADSNRGRLMSGVNVAGKRFEKGIGLGQISDGMIEFNPVRTVRANYEVITSANKVFSVMQW